MSIKTGLYSNPPAINRGGYVGSASAAISHALRDTANNYNKASLASSADGCPGVSSDDLRRAAERKGKWTSKRLLAIADLLDGMSVPDAARQSGIRIATLNVWKEKFECCGIAGLNRQPASVSLRKDISADELRDLAEKADAQMAKRCIAVANVLSGMDRLEAAIEAQASVASLNRWLWAFNARGVAGLGTKWQRDRLSTISNRQNLSAIDLRAAAKNVDGDFARRLLAVANLVDGMVYAEAARQADVPIRTLIGWKKRLEAGGNIAPQQSKKVISLRQDIPAESVRAATGGADDRTCNRLSAIADLLEGKTYQKTADRAGISVSMVYYLIHRFNENGIAGLFPGRSRGRPTKTTIRRDISADDLRDAAENAHGNLAVRFTAMANLLDGMTRSEAACAAQSSVSTIVRWLSYFNKNGMTGLRTRLHQGREHKKARQLGISADELRNLALDINEKYAGRLIAIAGLLEGMNRSEVAKQAGVSPRTVDNWLKRFNAYGKVGLKHRKKSDPRLTPIPFDDLKPT